MILILHGNGLTAISKKVSEIKKDFDPLATNHYSGKELDFGRVVDELSTPQLFSDKRLAILEDFDEKIDISTLPEDNTLTIIFKFPKTIPSASLFLKKAVSKKAQIINFTEKEETPIFPFLDMLAEKDKRAMSQLDKLLDEFGGQYLLTMIFYMLRRFILSPKKLPPFVIKKMENQKKNFPLEKIKFFYKEAIETDFKIKSGLLDEKLGLTLLVDKILKS